MVRTQGIARQGAIAPGQALWPPSPPLPAQLVQQQQQRQAQQPAAPPLPVPPPTVTATSRVAIPTARADAAPPVVQSRGTRIVPPRVDAPSRQQVPVARARRTETTFDDAPAPAPSKIGELRSTIARLQQRLGKLEPGAARHDDLLERAELVGDLLDEALELVARPDGAANRKRLRLKLEEAKKVLG